MAPSSTHRLDQVGGAELDRLLRRAIGGGVLRGISLVELREHVVAVAGARLLRDRHLAQQGQAAPLPDGATLLDYLPKHLADLHLAWACCRRPRHEEAWERLVRGHVRALTRVARAQGVASPREEAQAFFGELCLPTSRGRSLLDTYSGIAPLGAWLCLVFQRRLAAARRRRAPRVLPEELGDERTLEPGDEVARLELVALVQRHLTHLPARDRDLVEARVLHQEEGTATARRHGVSPSYVSRRYREVLVLLRARIAPRLRIGIEPGEGS